MKLKYSALAFATSLAIAPGIASAAQSVFGALSNFDAVNHTGQTARGFEIELEGLHLNDISDTFGGPGRGFPTSVERYGAPSVSEYTNGPIFGVRVTYQATYNSVTGTWSSIGGTFPGADVATPSGIFANPGDSCWSGGGIGYSLATPCDHFGVGTWGNPTKTTYSWLVESSPGQLTKALVNVPAPNWVVNQPPPAPGLPPPPPVVVAVIEAPEPEIVGQWGTAIWAKVFTTEFDREVVLEELMGEILRDLPPAVALETEMEWQLLQKNDAGNGGVLENGYLAPVGANAESVIRRYEFYEYIGLYKPSDHEAQPILGDSHADPSEVGAFLGAQQAGINLNGPLAIPEPETYAMMLAGLGLLGFVARRRKTILGVAAT